MWDLGNYIMPCIINSRGAPWGGILNLDHYINTEEVIFQYHILVQDHFLFQFIISSCPGDMSIFHSKKKQSRWELKSSIRIISRLSIMPQLCLLWFLLPPSPCHSIFFTVLEQSRHFSEQRENLFSCSLDHKQILERIVLKLLHLNKG